MDLKTPNPRAPEIDFRSPPVLAVTIVVMFGLGSCVGQWAHDFFAPEDYKATRVNK